MQGSRAVAVCVAALGNPGSKYANNRHNAGKILLGVLVRAWKAVSAGKKEDCELWNVQVGGIPVVLACPKVFMNESGGPIARLLSSLGISMDKFLVLHDDIDLPLGRFQLKLGGSAAGHHGVESLYEKIGVTEFHRLRVGVGRPETATKEYVLADFSREEREQLEGMSAQLEEGVSYWISGDAARAGQVLNTNRG